MRSLSSLILLIGLLCTTCSLNPQPEPPASYSQDSGATNSPPDASLQPGDNGQHDSDDASSDSSSDSCASGAAADGADAADGPDSSPHPHPSDASDCSCIPSDSSLFLDSDDCAAFSDTSATPPHETD